MCCLLTFILCYYHSLSLGENDNALGFKALRLAQHLRVLTFLVLIGWICVFRVTIEIGTTTLKTKTSLTGKSLKSLLPGMHITPGNRFCPTLPLHFRRQATFLTSQLLKKNLNKRKHKQQLLSKWCSLISLPFFKTSKICFFYKDNSDYVSMEIRVKTNQCVCVCNAYVCVCVFNRQK